MDPDFLHLADAHVLVGDAIGLPHPRGVLWRRRVDAVDGFFFEQLATRTEPGQIDGRIS